MGLSLIMIFLGVGGSFGMDIFSRRPFFTRSNLISRSSWEIVGQSAVRSLSYGNVSGVIYGTPHGNAAELYLGIPFATPPLADLRFEDPRPPKIWKGVLKTERYKPDCVQIASQSLPESFVPPSMSEDCLYLNVMVPKNAKFGDKLPVFFYIHGQGLEGGSPREISADVVVDNLVSNGVIFVSANFRLGILGFLAEGAEVSRNYGYKDILQALRWVKKEISAFGGDPSRVTIFGHGIGATIVSHFTIIPHASGLFDQAIQMSGKGSAEDTVACEENQERYELAIRQIGCGHPNKTTSAEVVQCLRNTSAIDLVKAYTSVPGPPTAPTIDGVLFPKPLHELKLIREPTPTLIGSSLVEFPIPDLILDNAATIAQSLCSMAMAISRSCVSVDTCTRYYSNKELSQKLQPNDLAIAKRRIVDDALIFWPTLAEAISLDNVGSRVFIASFDFQKDLMPDFPNHRSTVDYLLGPLPTDAVVDREISRIFAQSIVSFVTNGKPSANAEPVRKPTGFNYLSISSQPKNMEFYNFLAFEFWGTILPYAERYVGNCTLYRDRTILDRRNLFQQLLAKPQAGFSSNLFRNQILLGIQTPQERKSKPLKSVFGFSVFALVVYALVAASVAYVACYRRKRLHSRTRLISRQPAARSYSTFENLSGLT